MMEPHGGKLVNRLMGTDDARLQEAHIRLAVNDDVLRDAKNIALGIYSPLAGFLRQNDTDSVLERMRLAGGTVWPIPIVLDAPSNRARDFIKGGSVILEDGSGQNRALVENVEAYPLDKKHFAARVFGTDDPAHPGVRAVFDKEDVLIGGDVSYVQDEEKDFTDLHLSPEETRRAFKERGWDTVVAFQTRNVPHRSHEHLQKTALKETDGLLIHPVVGRKKKGDFSHDAVIGSYKVLLDKYYPEGRYLLSVLPMKMHYAGPREAVLHALVRKNFGCSHMIIGRDHAGVGNYYDSYAAHRIFDEFAPDELGIKILRYDNASFCRTCGKIMFDMECEHADSKVFLSGTKVREMIQNGEDLPSEFTRAEVSDFLRGHSDPFV
jgi:sulfate adenylyltransferase